MLNSYGTFIRNPNRLGRALKAERSQYLRHKSLSAGLLHGTFIKNLAFAALDKAFFFPVKIRDWAGQ